MNKDYIENTPLEQLILEAIPSYDFLIKFQETPGGKELAVEDGVKSLEQALARAEFGLARLLEMSDSDIEEELDSYPDPLPSEEYREAADYNSLIEGYIRKIRAVDFPESHEGLKRFLIREFEETLISLYPPDVETVDEYRERRVDMYKSHIELHKEQIELEKKRVEKAKEWLAVAIELAKLVD